MNSALLLVAYFTMLLSPCVLADYGDLLNFRWLPALIRRRRAHPEESLLTSFRVERCAMAAAAEAAFLAASEEVFAMPKPFLVQKKVVLGETRAFVQARQRVAARVAQLAVAQKLRNAAAAEEAVALEQSTVVEIPADVAAPEFAQPAIFEPVYETEAPELVTAAPVPRQPVYRTLLEAMGIHTSSRRTRPMSVREAVPLIAEHAPAAVFRETAAVPHRELAEVVPFLARGGPEPVPPKPRRRKPGESSDVVEIAA